MNMQNLESNVTVGHNLSMAIENSDKGTERGYMWRSNINHLFNIKSVSERNSYFDVTLKEPLNDYHVKTGIQDLKLNGKATVYSDKGTKIADLTFEKGIVMGPCTLFDDSGQLFFDYPMELTELIYQITSDPNSHLLMATGDVSGMDCLTSDVVNCFENRIVFQTENPMFSNMLIGNDEATHLPSPDHYCQYSTKTNQIIIV